MVTFYVVRHGQTILNQLKRAQGWCDSPLTLLGEQAARELGKDLSSIPFQAAYTSDTRRALDTAKLVLEASGQSHVVIHQDVRLREWCLGTMEAEKNQMFIDCVSEWLGGFPSFSEMNRRLPDVAAAIQQHDTTGTAESFEQISERLKSVLVSVGSSYPDGSNILVVTHAFLIKTLLYLFDPASMGTLSQIGNGDRITLLFDGQTFKLEI